MAFFKNFLPRKRTIEDLYSLETLANGTKIEDIPSNVTQIGTPLKATFFNEMQKGNVQSVVVNKLLEFGVEIYEIQSFDGIGDMPVDDDLKIKFIVPSKNEYDNPKIRLNGTDYTLMRGSTSGLVQLKANDLQTNSICNIVHDNLSFIIENGSLIGTETEAGIMSGLDIRSTEAAYITGAAYGDVFGTTLTSIEKGKVYYYWDSVKKTYIPYEALTTSAKSGGFITPDVNNFKNISNSYLAKIVEDIDGFRLTIDKQEKLLKVFRYDRSSGENIKTMNWVYNQIILFVKKHKYDLVNNTFISGYSIHQASNIQASYSTYYGAIFICYQTAGNQLVNTEQWYFHTGEMIIPIT